MREEYDRDSRTRIIRDSQGVVRDVICDKYFFSNAGTAQLAAQDYLREFRRLLGLKAEELENLSLPPDADPSDAGVEYRFFVEKPQFDTTTVAYYQTYFGLPVWRSGLAVHMKQAPFRVVSAQITLDPEIRAAKPSAKAVARVKKIGEKNLAKLLGLGRTKSPFNPNSLRALCRRLMVYSYRETGRIVAQQHGTGQDGKRPIHRGFGSHHHPMLPLPPVGQGIVDGRHYVVAAVDFRLDSQLFRNLHWIALIEAETQSILYLRALVDHVCGLVFESDPLTLAGGPPASGKNRELNLLRSSVVLQGLNGPDKAGRRSLSGEIIEIDDFEPPKAAPPKVATGLDFDYQARTDEFAAVNAYYHCDRFFRLVEELGFPRASYFKATSFPLPVDHRGAPIPENRGKEINARCQGNTTANGGLLNVRFALADLGDVVNPIGIACDWRIVLHELGGHATLWNHINYGHFEFAHSAGDSFAAILNDPDSRIRGDDRRFITFPWITGERRHDRQVAEGWGWGGANDLGVNPDRAIDPTGYHSEQILSTTHFRIYRSIGGDSAQANMRRFAARFVAYLILRTIGNFVPATNPRSAAHYATALMNADAGDWTSEGHSGGAYAKVIRWAFEKQGLYQPPTAPKPVKTPGAPPPVDVYIDDGRDGEYEYQSNYWSSEAIWNRLLADGGTTHQQPVAGRANFAYVKVKNRGTERATGVMVRAFHCKTSAGQVYPDDWQPMITAKLEAPDVASKSEITVGPFEWEPSEAAQGCMIMVASAHGDPSNIDNFDEGESIPGWRLAPHDNNIGQRSVYHVDGSGMEGLVAAFQGLRIEVKNPHDKRARMVVRTVLPAPLGKRDWRFEFTSPGGHAFSLEPRASREVVMRLRAGKEFTAEEIKKTEDSTIHVEVYADEMLVGGMSYKLDPASRAGAG